MSVLLSEVARAAEARQAPLAAESAGHLVLAIADQVALAPRVVGTDTIQLQEDGAVRLCAGEPCAEADAERHLRALLQQLLGVASSLTPSLVRVASRQPGGSLAALVAELEAALIPLNRTAARRALARLSREAARAVELGSLPPAVARASEAPLVVPPPVRAAPPAPAPALAVEPPQVVREPEPVAAPLVETRPEPFARRSSQSGPESSRTPRLGTLVAPAVTPLHVFEADELTDPMAFVEHEDEVETADHVELDRAELPIVDAAPEIEIEIDVEVELQPEPEPEPEPESAVAADLAPASEPELPPAAPAEPAADFEPPLDAAPVVALAPEPRLPRRTEPLRSELDSLLKSFANTDAPNEPDLRRELKKLAGLELTPPPLSTSDR